MKKIYLILLFAIISLNGFSQYSFTKGKLILKNGDTLIGYIKLPTLSKNLIAINGKEKVKFRKTRKSKKLKYDEKSVETIIFQPTETETAYYKFIKTSKKRYGIFKVITRGKATLYARKVSVTSNTPTYIGTPQYGQTWVNTYSFSNFDEFYVLKKGEEIANPLITARISRSFKKRAMDYFSDCPKLVKQLKDKVYNREDIREVVISYNRCN